MMSQPITSQPVTIVVRWTVLSGREAEFEAWLKGIVTASQEFRGHLGVEAIRPSDPLHLEYVLIFRFDNYENLRRWEDSPERASWLAKAKAFTQKDADYQTYTGLEYWFSLPGKPLKAAPPRWKMAAITWLAIFPLSYVLPILLSPFLQPVPIIVRFMLVAALIVLLMTYVVMPTMTRLFARWLFMLPKTADGKSSNAE